MSNMMLLVGMVAAFASVLVFSGFAYAALADKRRAVRFLEAQVGVTGTNLREQELAAPFSERALLPLLNGVGLIVRKVTPRDFAARLDRKLALAGAPEGWDVQKIMATKMIMALMAVLPAAVIALSEKFSGGIGILFGLCTVGMGFLLPDIALIGKGKNRQEEIQRSLPDTIDLLTIMVEAGLGFNAGLSHVTEHVHGPLSEEFGRMLHEMRLGVARKQAFRNLRDRTEVDELNSFITAMVQAETFGVSTTNVLRAQSKDLRTKRRQRAETKAQKLGVKLLFPLIFCIMPALFVVTLGPAAITIVEEFSGG
jgi:tight adherence protein C